jgi:anti-sigma B factor antagonist
MTEPASKLTISRRETDGVAVLTLRGELLLDDGDQLFRRHVHDLVDRGTVNLVVDLAGVTSIDSSGIAMMAAKLKTVRERGGDIKLVHMTKRSERLLTVMKILTIFDAFDDEAAAVRSFSHCAGA